MIDAVPYNVVSYNVLTVLNAFNNLSTVPHHFYSIIVQRNEVVLRFQIDSMFRVLSGFWIQLCDIQICYR